MKQKTPKSLIKRIKKTSTGKLLRRRMSVQHLAINKSPRSIKTAGRNMEVSSSNARKIRKLI